MDLDQQVLFGLMRGLVAIILPQRDIFALFEPCVAFCRIILPLLFVGCSGVVHRQESIFQCHHHSFRLIATMAVLTTFSEICEESGYKISLWQNSLLAQNLNLLPLLLSDFLPCWSSSGPKSRVC